MTAVRIFLLFASTLYIASIATAQDIAYPFADWDTNYRIDTDFNDHEPYGYSRTIDVNAITGGNSDNGDPVLSIADGTVYSYYLPGEHTASGFMLLVDHDNYCSIYRHMQDPFDPSESVTTPHSDYPPFVLEPGDPVHTGEPIGRMSNTGSGEGSFPEFATHLDWGIYQGGNCAEAAQDGLAAYVPAGGIGNYTDPSLFIETYRAEPVHRFPHGAEPLEPEGEITVLPTCDGETCLQWTQAENATHYDVYHMFNDNWLKLGRTHNDTQFILSDSQTAFIESAGGLQIWFVIARNDFQGWLSEPSYFWFQGQSENVSPSVFTGVPAAQTPTTVQMRGIVNPAGRELFAYYTSTPQVNADSDASQAIRMAYDSSSHICPALSAAQLDELPKPTFAVIEQESMLSRYMYANNSETSSTPRRKLSSKTRPVVVDKVITDLEPDVPTIIQMVIEDAAGNIVSTGEDVLVTPGDGVEPLEHTGTIGVVEAHIGYVSCTTVGVRFKNHRRTAYRELHRDGELIDIFPGGSSQGWTTYYDSDARPTGGHTYQLRYYNQDDSTWSDELPVFLPPGDCGLDPTPPAELVLVADPQSCVAGSPAALLTWNILDDVTGTAIERLEGDLAVAVEQQALGNSYVLTGTLDTETLQAFRVSATLDDTVIASNWVEVQSHSPECTMPEDLSESPHRFIARAVTTSCEGGEPAIHLAWTDSRNADEYSFRRSGGVPWTAIDVTGLDELSYIDTGGMQAGESYRYAVTAHNTTTGNSEHAYALDVLVPDDVCGEEGLPEPFFVYSSPLFCTPIGGVDRPSVTLYWEPVVGASNEFTYFHGSDLRRGSFGTTTDTTHSITGLDPGRINNITVRAKSASDESKVRFSNTLNFFVPTDACAPPTDLPRASVKAASYVSHDRALIRGSVHPEGSETTAYIEYGADTSYGSVTPAVNVGDGTNWVRVGEHLDNLPCEQTVFYRLVADSVQGVVYDEGVFETDVCSEPAPPTIALIEPDGVDDVVDTSFLIQWIDSDPDDDASIKLKWSLEPDCTPSTLIVNLSEDDETDSWLWDTSTLADGNYYIRAVITDGESTTKVCGGPIAVGEAPPFNVPPAISFIEPNGVDDTADESYTIMWTDSDPDDDASIKLRWSMEPNCSPSTKIKHNISEDNETDSFLWDTSTLAEGDYYIRATINDGVNSRWTCSNPVTVNHLIGVAPQPLFPPVSTELCMHTRPAVGDNGLLYATAGTTCDTSAAPLSGLAAFDSQSGAVVWGPSVPTGCDEHPSGKIRFGRKGVSLSNTGLLFAVGDWNECRNGRLAAFNSSDGSLYVDHGACTASPHPRHVPAIDETTGSVYFGSGYLCSVDMNAVTRNWATSGGSHTGGHGIAIDQSGNVYSGTHTNTGSGQVVSYSPNGDVRWQRAFATSSSPDVLAITGGTLLIFDRQMQALAAWDLDTGSDIATGAWPVVGFTRPVVDAMGVIYASGVATAEVIAIDATGHEQWRVDLAVHGASEAHMDFLGADNTLYVRGDATLYAINATDGSVVWEYQTTAPIEVPAALDAQGHIVLFDTSQTFTALDTTITYADSEWPVALYADQRHSSKAQGAPMDTSTILFADDFDDDAIDPTRWEFGGNIVTETGGVFNIDRTVTDAGGWATTVLFTIDPTKPLSISRRLNVYAANSYFDGRIDVRVDGHPEHRFGVSYANYHYTGNNECVTVGFSVFRNDANTHKCADQQTDTSGLISPVWGTWIDERIAYDPVTGSLEYFINDALEISYNVGPLPAGATSIQLNFSTWGWWTGHYQWMDDLVVRQE